MAGRGIAEQLTPEVCSLCGEMAGRYGSDYVSRYLHPRLAAKCQAPLGALEARRTLEDSFECLMALYSNYAFSRRGADNGQLGRIASDALRRTVAADGIGRLLAEEDARRLWAAFVSVCAEHNRRPIENQDRGAVSGLAELAQEIWRNTGHGSIALWINAEAMRTGRVEPLFLRMVDVRGIGPKLASLILRDIAQIFDIERQIDPIDRIYLQPIDKWTRMLAPILVPDDDWAPDWVLAGKLAKAARLARVSGPLMNMGFSHYGAHVARSRKAYGLGLQGLLSRSAFVDA